MSAVVAVVGLGWLATELAADPDLEVRPVAPATSVDAIRRLHPDVTSVVMSVTSYSPPPPGLRVVVVDDGPVPAAPPGVPAVRPPFAGSEVAGLLREGVGFALAWAPGVSPGAAVGPASPIGGGPTSPADDPAPSPDVPAWLTDGPADPWALEPLGDDGHDPWDDIPEVGADGSPSCDSEILLWDPDAGRPVGPPPAPGPGPAVGPPVAAGPAIGPPVAEPPPVAARAGRPGVIVFASPKGGSGKTSLSLHYAAFLADVLADRGRRVVWVDANLQQADGARYLGADERGSRTVMDLIGREVDERSVLDACSPPEVTGHGMWALFGPAVKAEADPRRVPPVLFREVVAVLRRRFDHVVVDTPVAEHHDGFFADFVLPSLDQLVAVVPPLLPVVRGVREWLELQALPVGAGGGGLDAAAVRIVLTMAQAGNGCPVEAVRDAWLTRWTWAGEVPYDPRWTAATNNGDLLAGHRSLRPFLAELVRLTTGDVVEGGVRSRRGWRDRIIRLLDR